MAYAVSRMGIALVSTADKDVILSVQRVRDAVYLDLFENVLEAKRGMHPQVSVMVKREDLDRALANVPLRVEPREITRAA